MRPSFKVIDGFISVPKGFTTTYLASAGDSTDSQIAQILVMQNEPELARKTVDQIEEDSDRLFALIGLADAK